MTKDIGGIEPLPDLITGGVVHYKVKTSGGFWALADGSARHLHLLTPEELLRITAEPGESIDHFAERMTRLRDFTDGDFIAVHNDHEVTVHRALGPRAFVTEWWKQVPKS